MDVASQHKMCIRRKNLRELLTLIKGYYNPHPQFHRQKVCCLQILKRTLRNRLRPIARKLVYAHAQKTIINRLNNINKNPETPVLNKSSQAMATASDTEKEKAQLLTTLLNSAGNSIYHKYIIMLIVEFDMDEILLKLLVDKVMKVIIFDFNNMNLRRLKIQIDEHLSLLDSVIEIITTVQAKQFIQLQQVLNIFIEIYKDYENMRRFT